MNSATVRTHIRVSVWTYLILGMNLEVEMLGHLTTSHFTFSDLPNGFPSGCSVARSHWWCVRFSNFSTSLSIFVAVLPSHDSHPHRCEQYFIVSPIFLKAPYNLLGSVQTFLEGSYILGLASWSFCFFWVSSLLLCPSWLRNRHLYLDIFGKVTNHMTPYRK